MANRIRTKPQLSVNQLGKYLEATGRGRNNILRAQKFPNNKGMILHYKEACDALIQYLDSDFDDDTLQEHYDQIGNTVPSTIRQDGKLKDCLDAIESFQNLSVEDLEDRLDGVTLIKAEHNPSNGTITINGVDISLRPEFYLTATYKKGAPVKGLIKLYFSRTKPLSDHAGKAIALLSEMFLADLSKPVGAVSRDLVIVIDVCAQKVFTAPKAQAKLRQDIEAACLEISRIWDDIRVDD